MLCSYYMIIKADGYNLCKCQYGCLYKVIAHKVNIGVPDHILPLLLLTREGYGYCILFTKMLL